MKEHTNLRGRRLLVVDADESVYLTAHGMLEPCGCIVEAAHNGQRAIDMICNSWDGFGYDCVIADFFLPDMSGYEFMLKLRHLASTPIVLMTSFGYDQSNSIARAWQAGLRFVLYKPFRGDLFVNVVERSIA